MQEIIEHYRAFNLAKKIMEKAHKNQTRVSGEPYELHPIRCFNNYAALIGYLDEPETKCYRLEEDGIPFFGVVEVALLHDVIEDTLLIWKTLKNSSKRRDYLAISINVSRMP